MKSIPDGYRVGHRLRVDDDMTVDFGLDEPGLGRLHPVYATYWMGKHFELVSRMLSLPFLEGDEEGMGFELAVRHLSPAPVGETIELEARYVDLVGNRLHCACSARTAGGRLVGEGSTVQVILPRTELERRFAAMREGGA